MQPSILDQINQNTNAYGAPALGTGTGAPAAGNSNGASSVLSQLSAQNNNQPTGQPQAAPADKGNWLTHLIPTIASIGGGLLGTLADPFTAGLGTVGGGAAGAGLGKTLENAIEGNSNVGEGVVGETALGALGGGIGKVSEGLISGAGKVLANTGEKGLANQAATKAAEQAVNDAQAVKNTYGSINKKVLENHNLAQTLETAKNLGIDHLNPQALSNTSNQAGDILNEAINNALTRNGTVDASNYTNILKDAIGQRGNILGSLEPVGISKGRMGMPNNAATKLYKQLDLLGQGNMNLTKADPIEVRNVITKLGNMAADAKPTVSAATGAVDPAQREAYNTINDVRGQLKDMLYNRPAVQNDIASDAGQLTADHVGGNQLLADHLNNVISNAQSPQDLLDEYSKFIGMGKIGDAAGAAAQNPATAAAVAAAKAQLPEAEGGALGNSGGTTLGNAVGASNHPVGKMLGAALNIGSNGGVAGKGAVTLGDTLQRIAGVTGLAGGETLANSPNSVMNGATDGTQVGGTTPALGTNDGGSIENQIINSNNPNTLALKELLTLQQFGGGYNVPTEMGMYSQPAATELGGLTQANAAEQQLQHYIALLNAAGGAQGGVGGFLTNLGSKITGGPAAQLDAERDQISQGLSKLTGGPVNLPGVTMDQNAANGVLNQLQGQIGSYGIY